MKVRYRLRLLMWIACLPVMAGCVTKTVIIRQSLAPIPDDCKGAIYVAQDSPIDVGIEGSDVRTKMNMAGCYLVSPEDMKVIVRELKKASGK